MSITNKALRVAWRRQAENLRRQFEEVADDHFKKSSGIPAVEMALIQYFKGGEWCYSFNHFELDSSWPSDTRIVKLSKRNRYLAVESIHKYRQDIPYNQLWVFGLLNDSGWVRIFVTNLLKFIRQKDNLPIDLQGHIRKIRSQTRKLLGEGDKLLKTVPFSVPEIGLPGFKWNEDHPRVTCLGKSWLPVLFEASWGPARPYGLQTDRLTVFHPIIDETCAYVEGQLPQCFFSISQDVLKDSVRLIDWLLSLLEEVETSEAKILTPDFEGGEPAHRVAPPTDSPSQRLSKPSELKAFSQYKEALSQNGGSLTDKQAYEYVKENLLETGESLPKLDTWTKQLRVARTAAGEQKNGRGGGHETRSVVRQEQS